MIKVDPEEVCMKKKIKFSLIMVFILLICAYLFNLSYAYFTGDVNGKETDITLTVSGGKIEINNDRVRRK